MPKKIGFHFYCMKRVIRYFLQGLLFVLPIGITLYIIITAIQWLDNLIPAKIPGLGLLIILFTITFVGFLGNTLIAKPILFFLEGILNRLPLVRIIYSSLKDLISAFVGDKKKFDQPVLVTLHAASNLRKVGFITQKDLSQLGLANAVAVYLPHSYNFSGNLFIIDTAYVTPIEGSATEIMKFVVSGGVSGLGK